MSLDRRSRLLGQIVRFGLGKRIHQMSPRELRKLRNRQRELSRFHFRLLLGSRVKLPIVQDCQIPTRDGALIDGRLFSPQSTTPLPLMVYFHGGGWTIGDVNSHDLLCRRLANRLNVAVFSVGYRLAPEHKFPTPLNDAYDALNWAVKQASAWNVDASCLTVAGDSAGGNLATVVSILARDQGGPKIQKQLLFYPVTNGNCESQTHQTYSDAPVLSHEEMRFFVEQYRQRPDDVNNPLFSPLLMPDLSELPPAMIVTAECDPLRDEGEEYANRLRACGTPAQVFRAKGAVHAFMQFPYLTKYYSQVLDEISVFIDACPNELKTPPAILNGLSTPISSFTIQ